MVFDFQSLTAQALSTDRPCLWDESASNLGLNTGGSAEAPSAPSAEPGTESAPSEDEAPAGDGGASGADAESEDVDVDPLDLLTERDEPEDGREPPTLQERYKNLRKRTRQYERSVKKMLPLQHALKQSGLDIQTLLTRHQQLANFEAAMERNPRIRALLSGEPDPEPIRDSRRSPAAEEKVHYPFDTNDEVGRFMVDFHNGTTSQQRDIISRLESLERGINARVGQIEQSTMQQRVAAVRQTWRSATTAAAEKLDKGTRALFNDAMIAATEGALSGRHSLTPQQVIDHYLKQLNVAKGTQAVASAAAKQRIAEKNTTLPRRSTGTGTPASAAAKHIPRLEEFNRQLMRKWGADDTARR